jgi:hypothetical protein
VVPRAWSSRLTFPILTLEAAPRIPADLLPVYQSQAEVYVAPPVQRDVCFVGGCYRLYGDGVTTAYQWVWLPAAPTPPPGPPSR